MRRETVSLPTTQTLTDEEFERISNELADSVGPDVPPLSDEAMSRESIYEGRGL